MVTLLAQILHKSKINQLLCLCSNISAPLSLRTKSALELPCERHAIPIPLKICIKHNDKVILITSTALCSRFYGTGACKIGAKI